jgi:hypothetical protein
MSFMSQRVITQPLSNAKLSLINRLNLFAPVGIEEIEQVK